MPFTTGTDPQVAPDKITTAMIAALAVTTGKIAANAVTNAKLAQMGAGTFKGNNTGGASDPLDMTANQTKNALNILAADISDLASNITTTASTVGALPSAATAGAGARRFVNNANATTFASVVVGGGANGVPVYSDGTNWCIG